MIESHYYSEDFELVSSFRAFYEQLSSVEKSYLEQVVLQRLVTEGSMVDILLCSVVRLPSAVPILAGRLSREQVPNQLTRHLIGALKTYRADEAYTAVERFLDSDQELETLEALAAIDFRRAIPSIVRAMKVESTHGVLLHIVYERVKAVGINGLVDDFRHASATHTPSFASTLGRVLHSKNDRYNPFAESEIKHIMKLLE